MSVNLIKLHCEDCTKRRELAVESNTFVMYASLVTRNLS